MDIFFYLRHTLSLYCYLYVSVHLRLDIPKRKAFILFKNKTDYKLLCFFSTSSHLNESYCGHTIKNVTANVWKLTTQDFQTYKYLMIVRRSPLSNSDKDASHFTFLNQKYCRWRSDTLEKYVTSSEIIFESWLHVSSCYLCQMQWCRIFTTTRSIM